MILVEFGSKNDHENLKKTLNFTGCYWFLLKILLFQSVLFLLNVFLSKNDRFWAQKWSEIVQKSCSKLNECLACFLKRFWTTFGPILDVLGALFSTLEGLKSMLYMHCTCIYMHLHAFTCTGPFWSPNLTEFMRMNLAIRPFWTPKCFILERICSQISNIFLIEVTRVQLYMRLRRRGQSQ